MAFCICTPFPCDDEGLTSVNVTGSSSTRMIPGTNTLIPGAATGTININGYAFSKGASDKWLGVRCPSVAQGSQTNYIRYDGCNDRYVVIPSRINSATYTGDSMAGVSFTAFSDCGSITGLTASIQNGVTVAQETVTRFGHGLGFEGIQLPKLSPYKVFGASQAYIQNLRVSSNFPQPAQFGLTFQFIVNC